MLEAGRIGLVSSILQEPFPANLSDVCVQSGDFFGVSALRHDKPRGGVHATSFMCDIVFPLVGPRDGGPRGGFRDGPRDFNRRGGARDDRDANATPREPPAPSVRKPLALVKPTGDVRPRDLDYKHTFCF